MGNPQRKTQNSRGWLGPRRQWVWRGNGGGGSDPGGWHWITVDQRWDRNLQAYEVLASGGRESSENCFWSSTREKEGEGNYWGIGGELGHCPALLPTPFPDTQTCSWQEKPSCPVVCLQVGASLPCLLCVGPSIVGVTLPHPQPKTKATTIQENFFPHHAGWAAMGGPIS